jgi:23S rRNA pseudouridine1911/1915/1917 synthase
MGRIKERDGRPLDLSKPIEEACLTAKTPDEGLRLDLFLKEYVGWKSRTELVRLIDDGQVTVNGATRKCSCRIRVGDVVEVKLGSAGSDEVRHHEIELDVLYEDEWLVVLNKQPGIVVHPAGKHLYNTLINALHLRYRNLADPDKDVVPRLVHRLDRDTSGVLLVSKDNRIRRSLSFQFENHLVTKEYLAIVQGELGPDYQVVDQPIGPAREPGTWIKRKVSDEPEALPAKTDVRVVRRYPGATLVLLRPFTGRTHQLRVHLTSLGHPMLCDWLYNPGEPLCREDLGLPPHPAGPRHPLLARQALHAYRLRLRHPVSGEPVVFRAPLSRDLRETLKAYRDLRRAASPSA